MAHTCPECGSQCYCNGDIDDLLLDNDEDVEACTCCVDDYSDADDDDYDPEDD